MPGIRQGSVSTFGGWRPTPPLPPARAQAVCRELRGGYGRGKYKGGFVDAFWANVDTASVDVLPPTGNSNRLRIAVGATFKAALDLFIIEPTVTARVNGWIEGDVVLSGTPDAGYQLVLDPSRLEVDGDISLLPDWLEDILFGMIENHLEHVPDIELNLGTQMAPLLACVQPTLTTNDRANALVLEWDVADLDCTAQSASPQ